MLVEAGRFATEAIAPLNRVGDKHGTPFKDGAVAMPPRDYQANLELTSIAQVVPCWTVQPVYTSIWHPSGTGIRYPDAQVAGVRSIWRF